MVKDGYLIFSYFVNAEPNYDYLSFSLDDNELMRASVQLTWKLFNVTLSKGFHKLKWVYSKDFSISRGDDLARIQFISIMGMRDVSVECQQCPAGSYRNGDMKECSLCPQNTFSKDPGTSICDNCPFGEESLPGATYCVPTGRACLESDVYYVYSNCQNDIRTKTAYYIQYSSCNSSRNDSYQLPPPSQVPCDNNCELGQQYSSNGCQNCESGKYRNDQMNECKLCDSGLFIQNEDFYIKEFYENNTLFTTGCDGNCKTNGWRMIGNYTDSGIGNGISTSWLEFTTEFKKPSRVYFNYALSCNSKTGYLLIEVNGVSQRNIECNGCVDTLQTTSIRVTKGSNTIRISYITQTGYSNDYTCDRAIISKITIQNSILSSGGVDCIPCPNGTFSLNPYTCSLCEAGFYSPIGSSTCLECNNDTFSRPGASSCINCGNGFQARISPRTKCDWISKVSTFKDNNRTYEWQPLVEILNSQLIKWNGHLLLINLDRDMMFCHGYLCILKNGTYEAAADSMDIQIISNMNSMQVLSNGIGLSFDMINGYNQTKINLFCSPIIGRDFQIDKDVVITDTQIDIYSDYGCSLCQDSDYKQIVGTCINGKRLITYQKTTTCARGVIKNPESLDCVNTVRFPYWILIVVPLIGIIFLGIVGTCVLGIVLKYWRLSKDYTELLDRQRENDINEDTINTDQITINNTVNPNDVILNNTEPDDQDIDLTK